MVNYQHERIVIIGLGITGMSCIKFFRVRGITPWVMDTRHNPPGLKTLSSDIPCYLGGFNKQWLFQATLIIITPGISLYDPILMKLVGNIEIIGDIELFARENITPIVAITGSNGKSSVTQLLASMASCAGWQIGVGGNIGTPILNLLDTPVQLYILELSSFQLETTYNLHTIASTVLNITEDHMDRYPLGFEQYRMTKLKIYEHASMCIINAQDTLTLPIQNKNSLSFGEINANYCLTQCNNHTWLTAYGQLLLNCNKMFVIGRHNYINALAALALADTIGLPRITSLYALEQFHGLSHRFELVYEHQGVRWINDSKSTNIGSTKAAIQGLKIDGSLHLLVGGYGKSANFIPLIKLIKNKNIKLYCFGQDGPKLANLYQDDVILADNLEQIMYIIGTKVKQGDVVLLSPACASTDQFINFEERGKVFTRLAYQVG